MIGLNIFKKLAVVGGLTLTLMSSASAAVTHIETVVGVISGVKGKPPTEIISLTGATGIELDLNGDFVNELYSVTFSDASEVDLFSDGNGNFDFGPVTSSNAHTFAEALMNQVFTGQYDTTPNLTEGCTDSSTCYLHVPFATVLTQGNVTGLKHTFFYNRPFNSQDTVPVIEFTHDLGANWPTDAQSTFAVFSSTPAVAAVPEPSTYAMLLAGLGLLGFAKRRQQA